MSRRIHVSKDLVRQTVHYLEQYHEMLVIWSIKTASLQKPGQPREDFRRGIEQVFQELQGCIASVRENLGDGQRMIDEGIEALKSDDFKRLMDQMEVQKYTAIVTSSFNPMKWPRMAIFMLTKWTLAIGRALTPRGYQP